MKLAGQGYMAPFGMLCIFCLVPIGRAFAQAEPGPLHPKELPPPAPAQTAPKPKKEPEVEPRKTLSGYWKFNRDESDDPRTKIDDSRRGDPGGGGGMGGPGRGPGIGYPSPYPYPGGPGNGPYGGPRGGGMGGGDSENTERLREMVRPADSLNINLNNPEVDLTDEHADKLVIYTDGRKIQKSKNDSVKEISAHWNGSQLITDERSPQGKKVSRTFELSPDGKQFNETWRIEVGRADTPTTIRFVYDAANPDQR